MIWPAKVKILVDARLKCFNNFSGFVDYILRSAHKFSSEKVVVEVAAGKGLAPFALACVYSKHAVLQCACFETFSQLRGNHFMIDDGTRWRVSTQPVIDHPDILP